MQNNISFMLHIAINFILSDLRYLALTTTAIIDVTAECLCEQSLLILFYLPAWKGYRTDTRKPLVKTKDFLENIRKPPEIGGLIEGDKRPGKAWPVARELESERTLCCLAR